MNKIRVTTFSTTFYQGIQNILKVSPLLYELFKDLPNISDQQCEDYAIITLIDTLTVEPPLTPEKLDFKQRLNVKDRDEIIYTMANEDLFGWKYMHDHWVFWFISSNNNIAKIDNADIDYIND